MIRDYKHVQNYAKPRSMGSRKRDRRQNGLNLFSGLGTLRSVDKRMLMIIMLVVVLSIGYLFIFRPSMLEFTVAEFGRIYDQFEGRGLLVKSEQVFYAPYAGKVSIFAMDGERIPVGDTIVELTGAEGKKVFFARTSGLVSFQVDGLETTLRPVMLDNFQQNYRDFRGKAIRINDGDKVNAGRPLFKLVDNFALYLLVEAPAHEVAHYRVGEKIWATFDQMTIIGWVEKILDNRCLFIIRMERFPDEMVNKRWVNTTIMTDIYSGIIVPRSAVIEYMGNKGVFVNRLKKTVFQPVNVVNGTAARVVVTGVDRGDEVLVNPEKYLAKYMKGKKDQ